MARKRRLSSEGRGTEPRFGSLHEAAARNCLKDVRYFLEKADVVVDAKDSDGLTPFALACIKGNVGVMDVLLQAGANPRQAFKWPEVAQKLKSSWFQGEETTSALAACVLSNVDVLELLLRYGVSVTDTFKTATLLVTAVNASNSKGAEDVVRLLLKHGAEVNPGLVFGSVAPLKAACQRGYLGMARLLLEHGAHVDADQESGLLHAACQRGDPDMVRLLLEHGANVDAADGSFNTALQVACNLKDLNMARLLLGSGASVDVINCGSGRTALHISSEKRDLDMARLLLQHEAKVDVTNNQGKTALHEACNNGDLDMALLLLEHSARMDIMDAYGNVALHYACSGSVELAELLVKRGADVRVIKGSGGAEALLSACEEGFSEMLRFLLSHEADANAFDADGKSALQLALQGAEVGMAQLLLAHGARADSIEASELATLLLAACGRGDVDAARLLLELGADEDAADKRGETGLHMAADRGDFAVVQLLLKAHARVNVKDDRGRTPLHVACGKPGDGLDLIELLLQFKAEVNQTNLYGETPLSCALRSQHEEEQMRALVELLVSHGANVNSEMSEVFNNPLYRAVSSRCSVGTIRLLLRLGARPNAAQLIVACRQYRFEIAELLLDAGAPVNTVDDDDFLTPLAAAVLPNRHGDEADEAAQLRTVALLVSRGADVNMRNGFQGRSPLHYALEGNGRFHHDAPSESAQQIVRFLLQKGADPNAQDDDGETPLRHQCKELDPFGFCHDTWIPAYRCISGLLLEYGWETNCDCGLTPFLQAAMTDRDLHDVKAELLEHQVDFMPDYQDDT